MGALGGVEENLGPGLLWCDGFYFLFLGCVHDILWGLKGTNNVNFSALEALNNSPALIVEGYRMVCLETYSDGVGNEPYRRLFLRIK